MASAALFMALASSAAGAVVGMTSSALSGATGWRGLRWISFAAWTASAFAACSIVQLVAASPRLVIAAAGWQYALASLHVIAWLMHSAAPLELRARTVRIWAAIVLSLAVVLSIPGVAFREPVRARAVGWLGAVYREPSATPLSHLAAVVLVALLAGLAVLHFRAWRRGVPHSALHGSAIAFLAAAGVQDALAVAGVVDLPDLLAPAALGPVVAVAWLTASRFVADARGLARLRTRLERRVLARARVLALSREALRRTDALASLGRLARRAAHEVNNPAASVLANLAFAEDELGPGGSMKGEVAAALDDALASIRRLRALAARLTDAGGVATAEPHSILLAPVIGDALELARGHAVEDARVTLDVEDGLATVGDGATLLRALEDLMTNAIEAASGARPPGKVAIRASREGEWITVRIEDEGPGMEEAVLRRLGEPFFTTRPFESAGLGVAVARALIQGLGGRLRFESVPGSGTVAVVQLPAAARPAPHRAAESTVRSGERGTWPAS